jgi:DNA-binding protein H-NS
MSVEELIALRDTIEELITSRIGVEKKALTAKLEAIQRFEARALRRRDFDSVAPRSFSPRQRYKAPAKYRNPSTGETWAGRGKRPRWMQKAIAAGHTQEEFRIGN